MGEPPATATRLAAVDVHIQHDPTAPGELVLPVWAGQPAGGSPPGVAADNVVGRL
jgi:hypothetical protein